MTYTHFWQEGIVPLDSLFRRQDAWEIVSDDEIPHLAFASPEKFSFLSLPFPFPFYGAEINNLQCAATGVCFLDQPPPSCIDQRACLSSGFSSFIASALTPV